MGDAVPVYSSFDESEHPIVAQLGGSNPELFAKVAPLVANKGYDAININCGCPSSVVSVAPVFACNV